MNIFQEAKQVLDKDGKVNPLGPYGKSKLTGQEVAQYFRKNKVSDSKIKKAVEVALDLGGAYDVARKEIKKFFGDKILKSKEVQSALRFANEEVIGEGKGSDIFKKYGSIINRLSDKEKDEVIELLYTMNTQSGRRYKEAFGKVKELLNMEYIPEETISEGKNLVPDIKKIVDTKGAKKVGGVMIDMFTASMISQIYDKVNDQNKKKMENSNIQTLVGLAQKMMQRNSVEKDGEVINEKVEYVEYKFKNKNDAQKALNYFKGINLMKLNINDDSIRMGELAVDAGNKDMTKYHKEVMRKFKPKVQVQEKSSAQQAAIAISKKEKAGKPGYDKEGKSLKKESVMDAYKKMWENSIEENNMERKIMSKMRKGRVAKGMPR